MTLTETSSRRAGWRGGFRPIAVIAVVASMTLVGCTSPQSPPPSGASQPASPAFPASPAPSLPSSPSSSPSSPLPDQTERFLALEERFDATVGVYAIDTASGRTVEYRADDRFGFASTIKALAAGVVLATATDQQRHAPIHVTADDLVPHSPIIEQSVGDTVTLLDAADAAVRFSDNAAANLLVRHLGGPAALEQQLRLIGDETTMVDRVEPELNDVAPGDDRDTSTPRALATALAELALGDVLDDADKTLLTDLLRRNTTGDTLIRAGAPQGWTIGDKTGTAAYGTRNDIALAWPPSGGPPIVLAILSMGNDRGAEPVDELLAEAAAVVFESFATE